MLGLERFLQSNDYPASEIILTATYLLIRPASFTCWLLLACPFPLLSIFLHFPIDFLFADFIDFFESVLSSAEAETRRTPWGLYLSLLTPSGRAGFPLDYTESTK